MKHLNKLAAFAVAFTMVLASCKKDDETVITEDYKGVIVINEGGFGKSNGSLGLYKPGSNEYKDDISKAQNGVPMGETVQAVTKLGDKFYVTVTGSQKIDVFGADFKLVTTITGLNSPRFITSISDTKAYVSNVYGTDVNIINPQDNSVSATKIPMPSGTEKLLADSGKAFIMSGFGKKFIYVVTTSNDQLVDSIDVGPNPAGMVFSGGKLIVLTTGDNAKSIKGKISVVGIGSGVVESSFELSASYYGGGLVSNGGNIFASLGGAELYKFTKSATVLPAAFITAPGSIYGFNIDANGEIYISDAVDYTQQGKAYRYNAAGTLLQTFKTGFVPNGFYFNY